MLHMVSYIQLFYHFLQTVTNLETWTAFFPEIQDSTEHYTGNNSYSRSEEGCARNIQND